MGSLWSFLSAPKNQKTLSWLGGGIVVVIAALWAAFVYLYPPNPPKSDGGEGKREVSASHGGVSIGGNVTNSTIKTSPAAPDEAQPTGY